MACQGVVSDCCYCGNMLAARLVSITPGAKACASTITPTILLISSPIALVFSIKLNFKSSQYGCSTLCD